MPAAMRLALCPSCENWQPMLEAGTAEVGRRCAAGIDGAPRVALCSRFLQAPGRGGIQEWVGPSADNEAQGNQS